MLADSDPLETSTRHNRLGLPSAQRQSPAKSYRVYHIDIKDRRMGEDDSLQSDFAAILFELLVLHTVRTYQDHTPNQPPLPSVQLNSPFAVFIELPDCPSMVLRNQLLCGLPSIRLAPLTSPSLHSLPSQVTPPVIPVVFKPDDAALFVFNFLDSVKQATLTTTKALDNENTMPLRACSSVEGHDQKSDVSSMLGNIPSAALQNPQLCLKTSTEDHDVLAHISGSDDGEAITEQGRNPNFDNQSSLHQGKGASAPLSSSLSQAGIGVFLQNRSKLKFDTSKQLSIDTMYRLINDFLFQPSLLFCPCRRALWSRSLATYPIPVTNRVLCHWIKLLYPQLLHLYTSSLFYSSLHDCETSGIVMWKNTDIILKPYLHLPLRFASVCVRLMAVQTALQVLPALAGLVLPISLYCNQFWQTSFGGGGISFILPQPSLPSSCTCDRDQWNKDVLDFITFIQELGMPQPIYDTIAQTPVPPSAALLNVSPSLSCNLTGVDSRLSVLVYNSTPSNLLSWCMRIIGRPAEHQSMVNNKRNSRRSSWEKNRQALLHLQEMAPDLVPVYAGNSTNKQGEETKGDTDSRSSWFRISLMHNTTTRLEELRKPSHNESLTTLANHYRPRRRTLSSIAKTVMSPISSLVPPELDQPIDVSHEYSSESEELQPNDSIVGSTKTCGDLAQLHHMASPTLHKSRAMLLSALRQYSPKISPWSQSKDDLYDWIMLYNKLGMPLEWPPHPCQQHPFVLTPALTEPLLTLYTRIKCRIPTIVLGPPGCGKTSLIMFLSEVLGIHLFRSCPIDGMFYSRLTYYA